MFLNKIKFLETVLKSRLCVDIRHKNINYFLFFKWGIILLFLNVFPDLGCFFNNSLLLFYVRN